MFKSEYTATVVYVAQQHTVFACMLVERLGNMCVPAAVLDMTWHVDPHHGRVQYQAGSCDRG